jgi:hypothetical protein
MGSFLKELEQLLNKYSKDAETNTPDFILAEFLDKVLEAYRVRNQCSSKSVIEQMGAGLIFATAITEDNLEALKKTQEWRKPAETVQ